MFTRLRIAARLAKDAGWRTSVRAAAWHASERWHERRLGIRSSSFVAAESLAEDSAENEPYEATGYSTLAELFRRIGPGSQAGVNGVPGTNRTSGASVEPQVLLDAGCGMGRAMVYAATLPYAKVIGFDIAPVLIDQARQNFADAQGRLQCHDVEAMVASATDYEVPDNVTTIFCFNPFNGSVMERFLTRVRESTQRRPRSVTMAFVNPNLDASANQWLKPVDSFHCFDPRMGRAHQYTQRIAVFRT
jgi:SAM-dependent methyltransferase